MYAIITEAGPEDETTTVTVTDPFGNGKQLTVAANDPLFDGLNQWLAQFYGRANQ